MAHSPSILSHASTAIWLQRKRPSTNSEIIHKLQLNDAVWIVNEEQMLDRLTADYLPAIAAATDAIRSRLYEIDEKISNIKTGEREIYGGGPGRQKYLLVVETATQYASKADDWKQLNAKFSDLLGRFSDIYEEHSFLEFVMYAPNHN